MIRVVLVEDEQILRRGLFMSVDWQALGYAVVGEAANGQAGLECILRQRPDVVITDIKMPVMDGLEMLRQARAQYHFRAIILTGYSEFEYAKQAITIGVDEYLLKPVDESELCTLLTGMAKELKEEEHTLRLLRRFEQETGGRNLPGEKMEIPNYYVQQVMDEIHRHYADKLSLEDIAGKLNVSVSYLSRKFKETMGYSFLDFLNQYRLRKAIQLLNTGKYRFAEVADQVGFNGYKHFHSVFTKYTDQTPSEFMKNEAYILPNSEEKQDLPDGK